MGKVSPKERETKGSRQKRRLRSSSKKYLKPGALAQLRYSRGSGAKSCTDIGKKRVAVLDVKKAENDVILEDKAVDKSPLLLSPVNLVNQNNLLWTPKTPRDNDCKTESRLEALPIDVLVLFTIFFSSHGDSLPLFVVTSAFSAYSLVRFELWYLFLGSIKTFLACIACFNGSGI